MQCFVDIGHTIDRNLPVEHDGWIAIDAVLHRLRQTHRGALHLCAIFFMQLLEALQHDAFGLLGIGRKAFGQLRLDTLDAIQIVDL